MGVNLLGIVLGILSITLGIYDLMPDSLTFARSKALRGGPAKTVGVVAVLLGGASIGTALFSFWNRS